MAESDDSGSSVPAVESLEPIAELTALAQVLHQGRLAMGLSLAELGKRLHMGQEQLEALELADRSRLPEPVFVIAQARRVAAALNVDAAQLIDALRACESFKSKAVTLNPEAPKPRPLKAQPSAPAAAFPRTAAAARAPLWLLPLGLAVAAAGWGLWSQRDALQALVVAAAQRTKSLPTLNSAVNRQPPAVKPAAAPVQPAVLRVRTATVSWMEITTLPGQQRLFRGMFRGDQRYPLGQGLRLRAGRPDQVQVALGSAPFKTLGTVKDIRWFRFQNPSLPGPPAALATDAAVPAKPNQPNKRAKPNKPAKPVTKRSAAQAAAPATPKPVLRTPPPALPEPQPPPVPAQP